MPEHLNVLQDENVPRAVAVWLRKKRRLWKITHTSEAGLNGCEDSTVFQ
jgi:hypothetical protein